MKSLATAICLLVATPAFAINYPVCSWDKPGVDPYVGDLPKAIDDYPDIPLLTRERLKERMRNRDYNEIVMIRRDSIEGRAKYNPEITDMHFGKPNPPKVCRHVVRSKWTASETQMGMVYCQDHHCILIPFICRNVSRITATDEATVPDPQSAAGDNLAPMPADPEFTPSGPNERGNSSSRDSNNWAPPRFGDDSFPRRYPDVVQPTPVDEPSTLWLFVIGAACYFIKRSCARK